MVFTENIYIFRSGQKITHLKLKELRKPTKQCISYVKESTLGSLVMSYFSSRDLYLTLSLPIDGGIVRHHEYNYEWTG